MKFYLSTKLRGNPTALATMVACLGCLLVGIAIEVGRNNVSDAIASALIGAAVGLLITSAVSWLGESSLDTIPHQFKSAALQEIADRRFYRANNEIELRMLSANSVSFIMKSRLIKIRDGAEVHPPGFEGISPHLLVTSKNWTLDRFEQDFNHIFPLEVETEEKLEVKFNLTSGIVISDVHRWNCPIDGFSLLILPLEGFKVTVCDLSGRSLLRCACVEGSLYKERNASFSHHGFSWKIERALT